MQWKRSSTNCFDQFTVNLLIRLTKEEWEASIYEQLFFLYYRIRFFIKFLEIFGVGNCQNVKFQWRANDSWSCQQKADIQIGIVPNKTTMFLEYFLSRFRFTVIKLPVKLRHDSMRLSIDHIPHFLIMWDYKSNCWTGLTWCIFYWNAFSAFGLSIILAGLRELGWYIIWKQFQKFLFFLSCGS